MDVHLTSVRRSRAKRRQPRSERVPDFHDSLRDRTARGYVPDSGPGQVGTSMVGLLDYGTQRSIQPSSRSRRTRCAYRLVGDNGKIRCQHHIQHRTAVRCRTSANRGQGSGCRPYPHHGICGQHTLTFRRIPGKYRRQPTAVRSGHSGHLRRLDVALPAGDHGPGTAPVPQGGRAVWSGTEVLGPALPQVSILSLHPLIIH
ncbi:hypothetical protein AAG570_004073 [Ranatra chinensis]|uniref:Uncharacterized protein n=1 Tax=Ranatra chinensis TaxID=642074 RepID=A0ABD0Y331_9HEMI